MLSVRTQTVLVAVLAIALFLLHTGYTDADLFAERIVRHNRFSATTLSFSERNTANNGNITQLFRTSGLQPEGFDVGAVRIKKDGKMNFKYRLKTIITNGDQGLCNALKLEVMQKGAYKYQGPLKDVSLDSNVDSAVPQDWIFFVGLDDTNASLQNKSCEFDFVFKTWRDDPDERKGFFAERILYNNISSGNWQN